MRRTLLLAVLMFVSLAMAGYALVAYTTRPVGSLVHPDMQAVFAAHRLGILTHIFASSLAVLLGPFQFVSAIRRRWPAVHRWIGRVYLGIGVLVGGLAGLYMSFFAFGGVVSHLGFGTLAVAWLCTGIAGYTSARRRDFPAHRAWMIRNYSLSLAAVTIRIGIAVASVLGFSFEDFYPVLTWACWVPNLVVAEWIVRRRWRVWRQS